jgi:hypothetical protein
MTIKPKWDAKSAGEYERRMKAEREDDDDIQDYKKPWVGLTQNQINSLCEMSEIAAAVVATELLLKEKNT